MKLESIAPGLNLIGVELGQVVTVVAAVSIAEGAVQVIYKTPDGTLKDRLLGRGDETNIGIALSERPWAFDGNGEDFKLAVEAKRIDLAFLFDPMMAVHTSNVEPLPHQITAVYEAMLPRQPLRFVLADDPGAGKTIMAGLYIRELIMRADTRRILVVAPGSLVEQWRDELFEKFGLEFRIFSKELEAASPSGNPFEDHDHLIVRLDQMSRNEESQEKLCLASWDLVVFDEAHKLSAHFFGKEIKRTKRFNFAEKIGQHTRHLLLMTATPHNGKEEDFQLFLSLLDSDRFYGKFRDGVHKVDCSDLIRRMVKEEMVKFDGTPLFPERKAYTVNYELSNIEVALYESVTNYVQTEMGKADQLDGSRKGSVGFALTALQRRLASSPEAIFQSLKRRKERLERRLREERLGIRGQQILAEAVVDVPEDDDDLNAEEQETLEETLVDQATASNTISELEQEIVILKQLEEQAKAVVASGLDRKWDELSRIAICAALVGSQTTGQGRRIDVSMLESTLASMGWVVSNYLNAGVEPLPMGNENFTAAPSGAFRTADGLLNIAANEDAQYEKLCDVIGRPELKTDVRFAERETRRGNRLAINKEIAPELMKRSAAEWEQALIEAGVPAGRVLSVPEILGHPHLSGRHFVSEFEGSAGKQKVTRGGFLFSDDQASPQGPAPALSEHTDAWLGKLGYDTEKIRNLRKKRVI